LSTTPSSSETRERLLRAAIQVFAERGYAGGTIRDICGRAQANIASVHYYFGDKQGLYAAIFDQVSAMFRERRARCLPAQAPPEERLRVYIQAALEEILGCDGGPEDRADLSAIYLAEMAHPTEVLDHIVALHIKPNNDELLSIVADLLGLDARAPLVIDAAACMSGQILWYFLARPLISRLNPDQQPLEERIAELVDRMWRFSLAGILSLAPLAGHEPANRMIPNTPRPQNPITP
jgi:TetR/AcrR family transcriptional regulator, regulator of cefoperazone and chloramphenicol sensitivity